MPQSGKLFAWIEPQSDDVFLAAFVGAPAASTRRPATQVCASPDEARQWVERQATALGIPVEWVSVAPQRQG
jgi:hypothetical protein